MKKLVVFIILIIIIFITFLFFYFKKTSYTLSYKVDEYNITESYDNKSNYYTFTVSKDDISFDIVSFSDYTNKRRLIETIETEDDCITPESSYVTLYSVCYKDDTYYTSYTIPSFNTTDTYENISISDLNNKTYLLWNYSEFIYLSEDKFTTISLFDTDTYSLSLIAKINNYLLIPDYDSSYYFDKVYLINANDATKTSFNLRYEIYFDSYILGNYESRVYLYDKKNELEYYIDIKKKEIYKTNYQLLIDGEWNNTTNQKLKNNTLSFTTESIINYELIDNTLYLIFNDTKIKILDNISTIVDSSYLDVYFISSDTLYYFNPTSGIKPLLNYSEWNFNYNNMIFIF